MTLPAWVDGVLLDVETARVSALDLGLRSGIGVFETLRVRAGATFRLALHLDRLRSGGADLGIEIDTAELALAIDAIVDELARRTARARSGIDDLVLRLTVTAGPLDPEAEFPPPTIGRPTRIVTVHPAPPVPLPPARAATFVGARDLAATKSTSYAAAHRALLLARAAGADLALLVDDGHVVEAANGNLIAIVDGEVIAPPVGERALPGITRAAVLEVVRGGALTGRRVIEAPLTLDELVAADAVLVTSAVAGLRDVVAIDGAAVGRGRAGHGGAGAVEALRSAFDALVAREAQPRASDALGAREAAPGASEAGE
ncbi:MAG: hypothetical protein RLZZ272_1768 [Actinomycetota bacterium]|jgi:branched-subunit amino acid aminotransferase/4-amino-4-deoxychorismate lyase